MVKPEKINGLPTPIWRIKMTLNRRNFPYTFTYTKADIKMIKEFMKWAKEKGFNKTYERQKNQLKNLKEVHN